MIVTINNNRPFCKQHRQELLEDHKVEPCICRSNGSVQKDCSICGGTGYMPPVTDFPFEFTVSESHFNLIWSALGLDATLDGSIMGDVLKLHLDSLRPEMLLRDPDSAKVVTNRFETRVDLHRAVQYITNLQMISREAIERGEDIIWY